MARRPKPIQTEYARAIDAHPEPALKIMLTTSQIRNKRCPTVLDYARGHVYCFEPNTPGYAILLSMIDGTWPDIARYEGAA
jgi:hypothetical protein